MAKNLPPILYKYRDYGNKYHRDLIFKRELYFAPTDQFNDPFDCSIPFRINKNSVNPDTLLSHYQKIIPNIQIPLFLERWEQLEDKHKIALLKLYIESDFFIQNMSEQTRQNIRENFGIVCLTSKKDNILMWSHYSNSHRGFCLGFDSKILRDELPNSTINKVHYPKERKYPEINFEEFSSKDVMVTVRLTHTKSIDWEYESEYRLVGLGYAQERKVLSKKVIKEVILGRKMTSLDKLYIIEFIRNNLPHVCIYDTQLNREHFTIDLVPVHNCSVTPLGLENDY